MLQHLIAGHQIEYSGFRRFVVGEERIPGARHKAFRAEDARQMPFTAAKVQQISSVTLPGTGDEPMRSYFRPGPIHIRIDHEILSIIDMCSEHGGRPCIKLCREYEPASPAAMIPDRNTAQGKMASLLDLAALVEVRHPVQRGALRTDLAGHLPGHGAKGSSERGINDEFHQG